MEFWKPQSELYHRMSMVQNVMKEQIPEKGRFSGIILSLVENPGKMLRPALLILCRGLDQDPGPSNHMAAALEYLHLASLVHDDIIDGAELRRGRPSVVSQYGLSKAIYTGDYLIWLAVKCLSSLDPALFPRKPADFMGPLLEAEAEQLDSKFSTAMTEADYLKRIEAKTGLLFSLASAAGQGLAAKSVQQLDTARLAGLLYGIAFQLRDDLQDLDDPDFKDLKDGNYTHPVLSALKHDPKLPELLRAAAECGADCPELYPELVQRIKDAQGPERTIEVMKEYLQAAEKMFESFMGQREIELLRWVNRQLYGGYDEN